MAITLKDILELLDGELMIAIYVRSIDPTINDTIVYQGQADRIDFLRQYLNYRVVKMMEPIRYNVIIGIIIQK